jgi:hypothetical protein
VESWGSRIKLQVAIYSSRCACRGFGKLGDSGEFVEVQLKLGLGSPAERVNAVMVLLRVCRLLCGTSTEVPHLFTTRFGSLGESKNG